MASGERGQRSGVSALSPWEAGSLAATAALALAGATLARVPIASRLVVLQFASTLAAVDLLLVAQSFGNESAFDVAMMLALLSLPAGLLYARFYERWL